jgi:hypothetical protein
MSTLISSAETFSGIQFEKNVILSRRIEGPSTTLDCLNDCLNVVNTICQFFVFRDGVCYIGRNDIELNNTQTFPIVTVHFVKGRKIQLKKTRFYVRLVGLPGFARDFYCQLCLYVSLFLYISNYLYLCFSPLSLYLSQT